MQRVKKLREKKGQKVEKVLIFDALPAVTIHHHYSLRFGRTSTPPPTL
jgi:hypothetical protein